MPVCDDGPAVLGCGYPDDGGGAVVPGPDGPTGAVLLDPGAVVLGPGVPGEAVVAASGISDVVVVLLDPGDSGVMLVLDVCVSTGVAALDSALLVGGVTVVGVEEACGGAVAPIVDVEL